MMSSEHDMNLQAILDAQKAAHLQDGVPSAEQRIDRLDRVLDLLVTHNDALCEAMSRDFGHRSLDQSRMTDISGTIEAVKFTKARLRRWMRPEKRSPQFPLGLLGAKAAVHFQPKGVVGIISPWNFPVNLALAPMASAFAAGNRVMIKPSEFTPATSQLMAEVIPQYYAREEVAVVTGGIEVGEAFSRLPFDHMMFTGATSIGYHVMRAAAENLVPLTLELGGKSPVIIGATADIDQAAVRVMAGKLLNAGQVCLAPDYVFVPEGTVDAFVDAAKRAVAASYPDGLAASDDYTAVINQRHHGRLMSYLEDAREGGAELIEINPADESFSMQHDCRMAPVLVLGATEDMKVMRDEIFGPILPIRTYQDLDECVDYINAKPRPLALYYFGRDTSERDRLLDNTTSGGVTVNDVFYHVAQEDLPFGGIGPSGMGAYHGKDGFLEFSHRKAVYTQPRADVLGFLRPPYGEKFRRLVGSRIKR